MSFGDTFASLLDKAKGLLSSTPTPADRTDAVEHDRFEQRLFEELIEEAPALRDLIEDMHQTIDYAPDLVRDTLMQLWQGDPRVRPESQMAESHLINHAVAQDMQESDALQQARQYTQHDKYGSAMAALGLSQQVREHVKRHEDELKQQQEEAEQARKEAEEAQEQLQQAMQQAQQMADDAEQESGDESGEGDDAQGEGQGDGQGEGQGDGQGEGQGDGQGEGDGSGDTSEGSPQPGGPSQAQREAQLTLEQAIAKAEAAQQAAEQASQKMRQQAAQAKREVRRPAEQALKQAAEDLEEERELFRTWGVEDGDLKHMDFKTRQQLAQSLRSSKMARYIKLIGRFKLMAAAQRVRKIEYGRDQIVGTEMSGDLPRVVQSEYAALAMGDDDLADLMELDFYKRWFEEQLLSREFEGNEKVGKGAIIAVWDESGSMEDHDGVCLRCGSTNVETRYYDSDSGQCKEPGCGGWASTREAWAKAFALALLDAAKQQKRDFVGIGFSSRGQQVEWRFPKGRGSQADVLAMVEHFFNGGTDFAQPMDKAVDILESEFNESGRMKGDIVFITDDACSVTPEWLATYQKRKRDLDFRVFGVALGAEQTRGALAAMSDNVRAIRQFADPSTVDDVFQVL